MANTLEEEVLVAAMEGDREEVKGLLKRFLPGELMALDEACRIIRSAIMRQEEAAERREARPWLEPS